jgi:hypothetical protein
VNATPNQSFEPTLARTRFWPLRCSGFAIKRASQNAKLAVLAMRRVSLITRRINIAATASICCRIKFALVFSHANNFVRSNPSFQRTRFARR